MIPAVLEDGARSESEKTANNTDKELYIEEIRNLAKDIGLEPIMVALKMKTIQAQIDEIPLGETVLNLCDGSDIDGVPGPSVAKYLEHKKHNVVGCDSVFIDNTLTKHGMKTIFNNSQISTPNGFLAIAATDLQVQVKKLNMDFPLFVKISDSYGSVGLDDDSVCHDFAQLTKKCTKLFQSFTNLMIEEYIDGKEFSVLVSGDSRANPENVVVYPPSERAFRSDLSKYQRFVAFDRNWDENDMGHEYIKVEDQEDDAALRDIARRAYISVAGNCYGRVDVRKRESNGKLYVLEVNASCGLGKNSSSDFILNLGGKTTLDFFKIILGDVTGNDAHQGFHNGRDDTTKFHELSSLVDVVH